MREIEVCVTSLHEAKEAYQAGAKRIELCSALCTGGVTPSYGCIKTIRKELPKLKINVLIRPRGGDFCYSEEEIQTMLEDIEVCKALGVNGIVIGALKEQGDIDIDTVKRLIAAGKGLRITFHRAFDCCNTPFNALEEIIALGCDRILTSGQKHNVTEGKEMLRQLVEKANGRIIIMPGSGVNIDNIAELESYTKAKEFHSTAQNSEENECCNEKSKELFGSNGKKTHRDIVAGLIG